jgi:hypothetical protein
MHGKQHCWFWRDDCSCQAEAVALGAASRLAASLDAARTRASVVYLSAVGPTARFERLDAVLLRRVDGTYRRRERVLVPVPE